MLCINSTSTQLSFQYYFSVYLKEKKCSKYFDIEDMRSGGMMLPGNGLRVQGGFEQSVVSGS